VLRAKGATFTDSLGQRPRICGAPKAPALKARFTSGNSPSGMFGIEEPSVEFESRFQRSIIWAISISWGRWPRLQMRQRLWRYRETTNPRLVLRFSEANGANQSPPLKPAQPKNAEQPTRDRRRLGNDRATNLDVIESELEIVAIGLPTGEQ